MVLQANIHYAKSRLPLRPLTLWRETSELTETGCPMPPIKSVIWSRATIFSTGELSSKFIFGNAVHCEVLTVASREGPTLVCQELSLTAERALKAMIGAAGISGRARRQKRSRLHCAIDPISVLCLIWMRRWHPDGCPLVPLER